MAMWQLLILTFGVAAAVAHPPAPVARVLARAAEALAR
jgi:hypothetical protein